VRAMRLALVVGCAAAAEGFSFSTLRMAPAAAAIADGVSDGIGHLSRPTIAAASMAALPLAARLQHAPQCVLGLGTKREPTDDTVADVPPLEQHPKRKVALFVEPTPFTHVSGYSNRFKEMLKFLQQGGDDAEVLTPDDSPDRPNNFLGMPITYVPGFRLIFYKQVQLTLDVGLRAYNRLRKTRPNLIHAVTPGFFVIPAILYARLLQIPLVISYHTHLPTYADRYVKIPGLRFLAIKLAEWYLPTALNFADLTLATSPQLQSQLKELGCRNVEVWRKGIDTDVFSSRFNISNGEMRAAMSEGQSERPLLLYVGRLGREKNIGMIKDVLERIPEARLAVVGTGPAEDELKEHFAGTDTVFMGLMKGEALSRAYAAADIFVMPSESETLGFVVLEAMASEVPPVGAAAGGIPNLVQDGVNGYLFKPGDVDDLTSKVRDLISDNTKRRRFGEEARQETLKWNWRSATSVLRNLQYTRAERNFEGRQRRWQTSMLRPANWFNALRGQGA